MSQDASVFIWNSFSFPIPAPRIMQSFQDITCEYFTAFRGTNSTWSKRQNERLKTLTKRNKVITDSILLFVKSSLKTLFFNSLPSWLIAGFSSTSAVSSLPVSAPILHNRKHIIAVLKSIIPQGLDWITPPSSSFLTVISCVCVCVLGNYFLTFSSSSPSYWLWKQETRINNSKKKKKKQWVAPVAHGSKTKVCVYVCVCCLT